MTTLVYKMTHSGDPHSDLGCWGVSDCMGRVRGYDFDAVIGISGSSWWTNEPSREGEIIWIGVDPQEIPGGKRGPKLAFGRFRYFREGERMLNRIAPKLHKAMQNRRFMLYGFDQVQKREIENVLRLAKRAKRSLLWPVRIDVDQWNNFVPEGVTSEGPAFPRYKTVYAAFDIDEERFDRITRTLTGQPDKSAITEEVDSSASYLEGAAKTITVNAYERNRGARAKCIEHHGWVCGHGRLIFEDAESL